MNEGVRIEVLVKDMIPFKFLKPALPGIEVMKDPTVQGPQ